MENRNDRKNSSYPYATPGLLTSPQAYMYTPYGGAEFLTTYKLSRQESFASLQRVTDGSVTPRATIVNLLGQTSNQLEERTQRVKKAMTVENVVTKELLADLTALYLSAVPVPNEAHQIIDQLRRKFEIKRLIHASLSSRLKLGGGATDDISVYAHLAGAFGAWLESAKDLRTVNALLKVNDILCGEVQKLTTPIDRALALFALSQELSSIEHLAKLRIPHVAF